MSDLYYVVFASLLIICAFEIVDCVLVYIDKREFQKKAIIEKSRREFGILRSNLFELAHQGSIDINSAAVQFLYLHLTQLVRRPDKFEQSIKFYIEALNREQNQSQIKVCDNVIKDIATWPKQAQAILINTVKIIEDNLFLAFAPFRFRLIVKLLDIISSTSLGKEILKNLFSQKKKETNIQQYKELNESMLALAQ